MRGAEADPHVVGADILAQRARRRSGPQQRRDRVRSACPCSAERVAVRGNERAARNEVPEYALAPDLADRLWQA